MSRIHLSRCVTLCVLLNAPTFAFAQAAPTTPAPAPTTPAPAPTTASPTTPVTPSAEPATPASGWSQVVERAAQQEGALETDEERDRREERLNREDNAAPLALLDPVARFGVRADVGGLAYAHDSGALLLGLSGMLVVPVDTRVEFFALPSFLGGIDVDSTNGVYGVGVDLGARFLLRRFFIGVGAHVAGLVIDTCEEFGGGGGFIDEECVRDELIGIVDGMVTAGGFLNPRRTLELGVTGRVGSETGYGNVSAYISGYIAYFWAL